MKIIQPRSGRPGFGYWLLLVALAVGCRGSEPTGEADAAAELPVIRPSLTAVAQQNWPTLVRTQGTLVPDETALVGARVAGRVDQVHVELGDRVSAGDPLITLEQQAFRLEVDVAQARLGQARAAVGLSPQEPHDSIQPEMSPVVREAEAIFQDAQQQWDRMLQLQERNAVSVAERDQVQSALAVAKARLDSARNAIQEKIAQINVARADQALAEQRLADSQIVAAFDGVVRQRLVAPGTYVQVGDPLVELVRNAVLRFRASVPERYARKLELGRRVTVTVEGQSQPISAVIDRISPMLDQSNRSLTFEADIPNPDGILRSGLFAEATVELDPTATALAIPSSAIVRFAGVEKVWAVVDGRSTEIVIEVGRRQREQVEVLQGLSPGDVIFVDGTEGQLARVDSLPAPLPVQTTAEPTPQTKFDPPTQERSDPSGSY